MPNDLKILRLRLGLNQSEMACELGVSLITYSRYERGKWPLAKPVEKLLQHLTERANLATNKQ